MSLLSRATSSDLPTSELTPAESASQQLPNQDDDGEAEWIPSPPYRAELTFYESDQYFSWPSPTMDKSHAATVNKWIDRGPWTKARIASKRRKIVYGNAGRGHPVHKQFRELVRVENGEGKYQCKSCGTVVAHPQTSDSVSGLLGHAIGKKGKPPSCPKKREGGHAEGSQLTLMESVVSKVRRPQGC